MTRAKQVENIMRLASVLAMARVRRFAIHQPNYHGNETEENVSRRVEAAEAELRAAVEALCSK